MRRPYYDRIAKAWHAATGEEGGPFKRLVLNEHLLTRIGEVAGRSLLELGCGNGYFARLLRGRTAGPGPERLVLTDASDALLELARRHHPVDGAEVRRLDVREPFPFEDGAFDLVLATMVFNELTDGGLARALRECARVLREGGTLLATVTHPTFVAGLDRRGALRPLGRALHTMPAKGALRVPVVLRTEARTVRLLEAAGFAVTCTSLRATEAVRRERPGLQQAGNVPIALVLESTRRPQAGRSHP